MRIKRRDFLKTAGGIALASLTQRVRVLASEGRKQVWKTRIAVFYEDTFPGVDGILVEKGIIEKALSGWDLFFLNLADLKAKLNIASFDLLVTPYGSAFPKEAWSVLLKYFRDGGNWVNMGGAPFSVPVVRESTGWRKEVRQTQYHKKLGITQTFPVSTREIRTYRANELVDPEPDLVGHFTADEIYELYVRFTETKDFPNEDGSAGPRDANLHALLFGVSGGGKKIAAPFVQIDRMQGDFAGGRWILANFRGTLDAAGIRFLAEKALQGSMEAVVRPSFPCYFEGELPSFAVDFRRPKGGVESLLKEECSLEVTDERERTIERLKVPVRGQGNLLTGLATMSSREGVKLNPGLYKVKLSMKLRSVASGSEYTISHANGFWVYDKKLMERGKPFTTDNNHLLRDGKPYPVTGTTYMGSDVHRKFLFEPNPYLWDRDFAEMKAAGINMVRTGIWTGWRNYMLDVGAPNEAALRAMDAFVLTAHRYDIPLIFTFFAFLPERWGGENPYLDPRSVNAQKEFIALFAQRYARVNDLIWDLINEPSFCNPEHLWSCRPNYDKHEKKAWEDWLKKKYQASTDEGLVTRIQEFYRATADEATSLPSLEEFTNANIFNERRPIKTVDYRLFAQEMFAWWTREVSKSIRANLNPHQLITVGQDEGGTYDGPSNQFFSDAVDFTCLHNWWLNDDLLWDSVVTKVPGKPNLVQETGVMFYEKMDSSAWRTEEEVSNLLERKMAISIGAGGAGFIEWIWNTNPFMKSDNEAAIGLHRADGTAKPELERVSQFARFIAANKHLMTGKEEPDVVMVIPHSQMFSVRNYATEATRRCVRALGYHCRVPVQAVSEYRVESLPSAARLIIVPSPLVMSEKAWKALLTYADMGATVLITGPFDADEHWLPVPRSTELGLPSATQAVTQEEFLEIDGKEYRLSYRGDKTQRVEKARLENAGSSSVKITQRGKGKLIWSALPVELADPIEPTVALYELAFYQAGISRIFTVSGEDVSVLILPAVFEKAVLYTLVNESDRDASMKLLNVESNKSQMLDVKAQRAAMVFVDRRSGEIISRLE